MSIYNVKIVIYVKNFFGGIVIKDADSFYKAAELFPKNAAKALKDSINGFSGTVYEIRAYINNPVLFVSDIGILFPRFSGTLASVPGNDCVKADFQTLKSVIFNASGASFYSYEKELNSGYITCAGGIRIGVCGLQPDKTFSPDRITSLNIRLPHSESFCLPAALRPLAEKGGLLFAGAPGSGKTTMLKACCRELSCIYSGRMKRVSVIDRRGELSSFSGTAERYAADIVACRDPAEGIQRALRLMSPEYIICDELGTYEETLSMLEGMNSGVKFIGAIHAGSIAELKRRSQFTALFCEGVFTDIVLLDEKQPGQIKETVNGRELEGEIYKYNASLRLGAAYGN